MLGLGFSLWRPNRSLVASALADLWAAGQQGLWYDPSDLTTLYQDSAGTTAVTAVTQPTGLMFDKRKGLVRGPERVSNGTFSSGVSGWTAGYDAAASTFTASGGVATLTRVAPDANPRFSTAVPGCVIGTTYEITLDLVGATGIGDKILVFTNSPDGTGGATLYQSGSNTPTTLRFILPATATTMYLAVTLASGGVAGSISVDNVSVKELPANHASQATAAARPLLNISSGAQYLTFDGIDDGLSTGAITLGANMDCAFAIRRNSTAPFLIASAGGGAYFCVTGGTGSADASVGTPLYAVNGTLLNGGAVGTNRAQLDAALPSSSWFVVEVRNLDLSGWASFAMGNYPGFALNGDIAGIVLAPAGDATSRQKIRTYLGAKVGLTFAATTAPANAIYDTSGSVITDSSGSPITTS